MQIGQIVKGWDVLEEEHESRLENRGVPSVLGYDGKEAVSIEPCGKYKVVSVNPMQFSAVQGGDV